ncbi:hypothetical protein DH2020_025920 [Rehmannia glutinosa]|uniref:SCP domain-containing protein n=1 Tax=Rehmannia glutinosa TaxID=99300 RepID=A0ABR0W2K9_REHGL
MPRARILCFLIIAAALVASATADLNHSTPRDKLKKRNTTAATPPQAPFVPTFNWEQREYLRAHNDLRRRVGVPPLVWDPILTAAAHGWAEQRRRDCNYRYHSTNKYGENIYWMSYKEFDPTDAVQYWFNEYKLYDRTANACRCRPEIAGCECGHYLNVVWSTTRRVGCSGAVYCDNQKGVYVVCNYDPAGLVPGINPFTGLKLRTAGNFTI